MTVDLHQHLLPPSHVTAFGATVAGSRRDRMARMYAPFLHEFAVLDSRLVDMDDSGIELAMLGALPVGPATAGESGEADLIRLGNDELITIAQHRSDRFGAMVSLPLPDTAACLRELRRVAGEPAVRAVILFAPVSGWTLDEKRFIPVLAAIAAAGVPVLLHPALEPPMDSLREWSLAASLGPVLTDTIAATRLVLSGVLDRVPELALIVPHLGGALPFVADRIAELSGQGDAAHDVTRYLRTRLFLDSCSRHAAALRCAVDTAGAERVVFGSDYPFRGSLRAAVGDLSVLAPDEWTAIASANARNLLQ